jgi:hypothetical protein
VKIEYTACNTAYKDLNNSRGLFRVCVNCLKVHFYVENIGQDRTRTRACYSSARMFFSKQRVFQERNGRIKYSTPGIEKKDIGL